MNDIDRYFEWIAKQGKKVEQEVRNSKLYNNAKTAINDLKEAHDYECAKQFYNSYFMPTDIVDSETSKTYRINLPGYKKKNISVYFEDKYLVVMALKEKEEKLESYDMKEREHEDCIRKYKLSEDLERNAKATYEEGVLTIQIDKKKIPVTQIDID